MPSLAKISKPRLPTVLPRTRLFRRLDRARGRPLTWVTGPPGAGKTTLVASWVASRRLGCLWYQLDAGDADPATFFYYLARAAAQRWPRRAVLPAFGPEYALGLEVFARRFFRELCAPARPPFVIVLDNVQDVPADSPVLGILRDGVAELPEGVSAVMLSRGRPPPALARLRAHELVEELGADELRVDVREAAAIARLRGVRIERSELVELCERVRGWTAGLVLTVARRRAGPASHAAPGRGASQAALFDYFAAEMFEGAPDELKRVLLVTAILPRVTASESAQLSGCERAGALLAQLARQGWFTTLHDDVEPIFEYHPLFREFLLSRGAAAMTPGDLAALRRAAGLLVARSGKVEAAVELLRDAGAWEELADLVARGAPALMGASRAWTLASWISAIPEPVVRGRPWLRYWLGLARLSSAPVTARADLVAAYDASRASGDREGVYLAWAAVVDSHMYAWQDLAGLDPWIAALEDFRRELPDLPGPEVEGRVLQAILAALVFRRPDHPSLDGWIERGLAFVLAPNEPNARVLIATFLVLHWACFRGEPHRAAEVVETIHPLVDTPAVPPLTRIRWLSVEAAYFDVREDGDAALRATRDGLELARSTGVHLWDCNLEAQGVWAALVSDDAALAMEFLERVTAKLPPESPLAEAQWRFARCTVALQRRAWAELLDESAAGVEMCRRAGFPFGEAMSVVARARGLAETGRREAAAEHLEVARRAAATLRSHALAFVCDLVDARLAYLGGELRRGDALVARAFALGRTRGVRAHYWFSRAEMAALCARALESGSEVEYAVATVRRLRLAAGEHAGAAWPWAVKIRALGPREILRDGAPVTFGAKLQRRPLALLDLLVASGRSGVAAAEAAEALWPDAEGDAARHALETTVYRLRKLLGAAVVATRDGRLWLDRSACWVDAWEFERSVDAALATADGERAAELAASLERALQLYRGPYLAETDAPWALAARRRLRRKLARCVEHLAARAPDGGGALWQRALSLDPELGDGRGAGR